MENKFKLELDGSIDLNSINTSVVLCLSTEFLIDLVGDVFKKHLSHNVLEDLMTEFTEAVDKSTDIAFSSFEEWNAYKSQIFMSILDIVKRVDEVLTNNNFITRGDVVESVQMELNGFAMSLGGIIVDWTSLDLGSVTVKPAYIDTLLEQLALVNECFVLCKLAHAKLDFTPIDISPLRNKFIDEKLNSLEKVTSSAEKSFNGDYDNIISDIMSMNSKFYSISNDSITDSEKAEKARKLVRGLNSHKKLLDRLENKLTKGNELKRQLTLHKNKLASSLEDQNKIFDEDLINKPEERDLIETNRSNLILVTDQYTKAIDSAVNRINTLEENISTRYKKLDLLETSLKSSIPTEGEMKKFSQIIYKFQELAIKLQQAKTNIADLEIKNLIEVTIPGLDSLAQCGKDLKELYMRNTLLSAIFKTVDVIFDFADSSNKAERVKNMLVVNDCLEKYNKLALKMSDDFFNARKVANDTIRNIAMTMCKNYTKKAMKDIIQSIEVAYKGMNDYIIGLDNDNKSQIELINLILTIENE